MPVSKELGRQFKVTMSRIMQTHGIYLYACNFQVSHRESGYAAGNRNYQLWPWLHPSQFY